MCFTIDQKATAPRQRKVFKVVKLLSNGRVVSPFIGKQWKENGVVQSRPYAPTHFRYSSGEAETMAGIYVVLDRVEAEAAVGDDPHFAILELDVKPSDWLFTSDKHGARCFRDGPYVRSATYRKVRVSRTQRYLKWY